MYNAKTQSPPPAGWNGRAIEEGGVFRRCHTGNNPNATWLSQSISRTPAVTESGSRISSRVPSGMAKLQASHAENPAHPPPHLDKEHYPPPQRPTLTRHVVSRDRISSRVPSGMAKLQASHAENPAHPPPHLDKEHYPPPQRPTLTRHVVSHNGGGHRRQRLDVLPGAMNRIQPAQRVNDILRIQRDQLPLRAGLNEQQLLAGAQFV